MKSHSLVSLVWHLVLSVVVLTAVGLLSPRSEARVLLPRYYKFEIDKATPVKDLLPTPPRASSSLPAYLNEDLAQAAELTVGNWLRNHPKATDNAEEAIAHAIAKINHLNRNDPDGFFKALSANRADLRGLPFLMGKACRTEKQQAALFAESVQIVRRIVHNIAQQDPEAASVPNDKLAARIVFREFKALEDKGEKTHRSRAAQPDADRADVAGLMQMFGPQPAVFRVGLARYLTTIDHIDATQALAKLALFAPEESVHNAALDGLKGRPKKDYANILMQGFRYPLPAVSKRAADALVKLQCQDVRADLVNVLEQPDPRAPVQHKIDGKAVTEVRELVRVNHRQNCLLCHAPANTGDVPTDVLTVAVPLPNQTGEGYYHRASPDIFVRTDVTYLRQDFSMMLPVDNAEPSAKMQRFDFLVRTRVLSVVEAAACEKELAKQGTPPSHSAAQFALRGLTGQAPAEATPAAWRRLLQKPKSTE